MREENGKKERGKKGAEWAEKGLTGLKKYRYVLLVALVGVVLLAWPSGESRGEAAPAAETEADVFETAGMEEKLEKTLSQIRGAGKVTVALALEKSPRQILAQDGSAAEGEGQTRRETSTVLVSNGSGGQEPALLQRVGPEYRGALVVSEGGDDPQVRLALSEAVSALTGLGTDKITICKGK